jgi:hypothetical protein
MRSPVHADRENDPLNNKNSLSLTRIICVVSLILLTVFLVIGFALVQQWVWAAGTIIIAGAWILSRRYAAWLLIVCLILSVSLAVAGKLMGIHPLLAIGSCGLALVVWDLLSLDIDLGGKPPEGQTRGFEINHLQSLGLAVGCAFFAALIGQFLRLKIPFFLLAAAILVLIIGLDRVWGYLKKKR